MNWCSITGNPPTVRRSLEWLIHISAQKESDVTEINNERKGIDDDCSPKNPVPRPPALKQFADENCQKKQDYQDGKRDSENIEKLVNTAHVFDALTESFLVRGGWIA